MSRYYAGGETEHRRRFPGTERMQNQNSQVCRIRVTNLTIFVYMIELEKSYLNRQKRNSEARSNEKRFGLYRYC